MENDMRKPISLVAIAVVVVGVMWAWTLTQSGASARHKVAGASVGINILDLMKKARPMPSESFPAY
jgi:hypothetical protein